MKEYSNDTLTLDDLLRDLKRNVSQADIILGILNQRGALSNGRELIRGYSNLWTVLIDPPCNLMMTGEPALIECECPEFWFPEKNRARLRKISANAFFHHHENCPIQIAYAESLKPKGPEKKRPTTPLGTSGACDRGYHNLCPSAGMWCTCPCHRDDVEGLTPR